MTEDYTRLGLFFIKLNMITTYVWKVLSITNKIASRWPYSYDCKTKICSKSSKCKGKFICLFGAPHIFIQICAEIWIISQMFMYPLQLNKSSALQITICLERLIQFLTYAFILTTAMWKQSEVIQVFNGLMLLDKSKHPGKYKNYNF